MASGGSFLAWGPVGTTRRDLAIFCCCARCPNRESELRLSERVNNRDQPEYTGKSVQQADRLAGPILFVADELEPFQANRLGFKAHLDRELLHDP